MDASRGDRPETALAQGGCNIAGIGRTAPTESPEILTTSSPNQVWRCSRRQPLGTRETKRAYLARRPTGSPITHEALADRSRTVYADNAGGMERPIG